RIRNQVPLDHARCRDAADEIAPEQQMKGRRAHQEGKSIAQRLRRGATLLPRDRLGTARPYEQKDDDRQGQSNDADADVARAPVDVFDRTAEDGDDDELAAGGTGGRDADRQTAMLDEVVADDRRDDVRGGGTEAHPTDDAIGEA